MKINRWQQVLWISCEPSNQKEKKKSTCIPHYTLVPWPLVFMLGPSWATWDGWKLIIFIFETLFTSPNNQARLKLQYCTKRQKKKKIFLKGCLSEHFCQVNFILPNLSLLNRYPPIIRTYFLNWRRFLYNQAFVELESLPWVAFV